MGKITTVKAKYIWETVTGNYSLKISGFADLQRDNPEREFKDLDSLINAAIRDVVREGDKCKLLAYQLSELPEPLKGWLKSKYDWINEDSFDQIAEVRAEEAEFLKSFLAMYKAGDERAKIPVSLARFDTRPPKKKNPIGRPKKYTNDDRPYWVDDPKLDEPIQKPPMPKFDDTEDIEEVPEYVREARELFK